MHRKFYWPACICLGFFTSSCGSQGNGGSGTHKQLAIESVMDAFVSCRLNSEEPHECRWHTAKAICGYFMINDFANDAEPGGYIAYDEIGSYVSQSPKWRKLGSAEDQTVLINAAKISSEGKATIAFKENSASNNVAIILGGRMVHSSSWDLKCPSAAIFFPNKPSDSFVGKGLNYCWSSPGNVVIYVRNH